MQDNVFYAMPHDDIPFSMVEVVKRHLDMSVFPNPVADEAKFKAFSTLTGDATVCLMDVTGRRLVEHDLEMQIGENIWTMPVDGILRPGVYLAQLRMADEVHTIKLIKH
jgi:hypothetical protein